MLTVIVDGVSHTARGKLCEATVNETIPDRISDTSQLRTKLITVPSRLSEAVSD